MTDKNPKRIGGRGREVFTPRTLAEQLAEVSEREIAEKGPSYLRPRVPVDVVPERENFRVASPDDRLRDFPDTGKPGVASSEGDTPPGYIRDERGRIRPLTARDYARMERERKKGRR